MTEPRHPRPLARYRALGALAGPLAAALVTAGLLAPFVDKAFHVDDTLFLAVAEHVREAPLAPYDFSYNWFGEPQSMWQVTQNPPLNAYLLAAVGAVAPASEIVHHLVYLALAAACAAAMYVLAARLCGDPLAVVALTVAGPAFLVSATGVMADIPLMLLWTLAVLFALRSGEPSRAPWAWALAAAVAAAAAAMTKYFGAALVPLVAAWTLMRGPRRAVRLAVLVLPVAVLALWGWYSQIAGGTIHPLAAAGYGVEVSRRISDRAVHVGNTLAFLGGALAWPVAALALLRRSPWWTAAVVAAGTAVTAGACIGGIPPGVRVAWVVMVAGGIAVLALAARSWRERPDAESALLALWLFGTVVFVAAFNWTVAARVVLPTAFPAAVLIVRGLESGGASRRWTSYVRWTALPVAALSVPLALADREWADAGRRFARDVARPARHELADRDMTFLGHWGFQYYMEHEGFRARDLGRPARPGEIVFVARNNTNIDAIDRVPTVVRVDRLVPSSFGIHTMNKSSHAGFYSTIDGPVPFAPSRGRPCERLVVYEILARPD